MKRLFFALDISPAEKVKIAQWRAAHCNIKAKAIAQDNFHITLAFLGMVDNETEQGLCQLNLDFLSDCQSPAAIKLKANSLGLFKRPQVLYLGFSKFEQKLTQLALNLIKQAKQLKIKQEDRPYLPHFSIYRKAKYLPNLQWFDIELNISSFSLYHSRSTTDGVQYSPIKTWSLVKL